MFFEKKYLKKKEEYLKEIINSMNENGFKNPDFYLKDGTLFLINRENKQNEKIQHETNVMETTTTLQPKDPDENIATNIVATPAEN